MNSPLLGKNKIAGNGNAPDAVHLAQRRGVFSSQEVIQKIHALNLLLEICTPVHIQGKRYVLMSEDFRKRLVADGLFCREIDGLFCRSSPDIIVRRRCVLSHKRRGWLQPSPSFRYSRNLALQDELYHPVINNGPAVLVCVDKRLGTGPVNQSRDAG